MSATTTIRSGKPHTAIVAEGGGQRGIYTAGVLDALQHAAFNPFSLGVGASAGAQNLLSYFLGEPGYAHRAIVELTMAPDFFVPYRWLGRRGIIDLDAYFERTVQEPGYRLPYSRIEGVRRRRRLVFVATDQLSLQAVYLEPDSQTVIDSLKASSAVPFLYKPGVQLDGRTLVDGGVADPLPVRFAYEQGARRILLIRSTPAAVQQTSWSQRIDSLHMRAALPELVMRMLDTHEASYQAAREFIEQPPDDLDLQQIAPEDALQSHSFGSRSKALRHDYGTGLRDGRAALMHAGSPLSAWSVADFGSRRTSPSAADTTPVRGSSA